MKDNRMLIIGFEKKTKNDKEQQEVSMVLRELTCKTNYLVEYAKKQATIPILATYYKFP
jgi:hypothetical protein